MTTSTKSDAIVLKYTADWVTVEPEDEDRFAVAAQRAVEACKQVHHQDRAFKRFKQDFLMPLRQWCEGQEARVDACYIPFPTGHLEVYVIGSRPKYDFDLGRELSRLELELSGKGWRVNVLQIPAPDAADADEGLRAHFDYDGALKVYAHGQPAQNQG